MSAGRPTLVVCLIAVGVCTTLEASRTLAQQKIRSGIDITRLVVSVLDRQRLPVKNLTGEDFTLRIDGERRKVLACDPLHFETTLNDLTNQESTDSRQLSVDLSRIITIVIDDAMMAGDDPWATEKVREIAREIISRVGETDSAAVLYTASGQSFLPTNNKEDLLRAVAKFRPQGPLGNLGPLYSLRTIENAVASLRDFTDRRKMVFYIGGGVRVNSRMLAQPTAIGVSGDARGLEAEKHAILLNVVSIASTAAIPIYSIDPYGLLVGVGGSDPRKLERDFLKTLAANSGGFAIVSRNEFSSGLQRIIAENTDNYLLAYETLPKDLTKSILRIEVRTTLKNVVVRAPQQIRTHVPRR